MILQPMVESITIEIAMPPVFSCIMSCVCIFRYFHDGLQGTAEGTHHRVHSVLAGTPLLQRAVPQRGHPTEDVRGVSQHHLELPQLRSRHEVPHQVTQKRDHRTRSTIFSAKPSTLELDNKQL